ncbi:hypothetical protein D9M71_637450 [compost metagenome]
MTPWTQPSTPMSFERRSFERRIDFDFQPDIRVPALPEPAMFPSLSSLIDDMAAFSPPAPAFTALNFTEPTTLQPLLAANAH